MGRTRPPLAPRGSRRSASFDRRSRHGSVSSLESAVVDDNTSEMFSGAASEVIPSSISSFHYAHHFGRGDDAPSQASSPLLAAADATPYAEMDLYRVQSNATAASDTASGHFRFFTADEIEAAPGGSTIENADCPVDYNTHWEYSVDSHPDDGSAAGVDFAAPFRPRARTGSSERTPRSPGTRDAAAAPPGDDLDASSYFEARFRRRSSAASDKSSSGESQQAGSDGEHEAFLHEFAPRTTQQRYYLAEEDIVVGIAGYANCWWKSALYYAVCVGTLGAGYLVLRWVPRYRINLKGQPCALGRADWCIVENQYGELVTVDVARTRFGERLSAFLTVPPKSDAEPAARDANPVVPQLRSFEYRYIKFFYSPVDDMFKTNTTWYDAHWLNDKTLRDGLSQSLYEQRAAVFGENNINIEKKSTVQLLADEVLHPFYIFQVFSIFLWLADDYYYYASCIFVISVASIASTLVDTKATIARLQEIGAFTCDIRAWRNGFWTQTESNNLVPGDVFEVDPSLSVLPCDALLINGECVVNESMLTGESVPVSKTSASQEAVQHLPDSFTHPVLARSFLYSGTRLLKMKSTNDEPVLAVAIRTGFNTTKGSLVRSMLFPKPTGFKFYEDSFKYIGFMTLIAFLGFIYSTYNFIQLGLAKRTMLLRALDIITIVVPPALPATLTIGTSFAVGRLKKKNIFCIAPTCINIGGKLDVVCFDKTGTLTEDGLDVLGVHAIRNADGRKELVFDELVEHKEGLAEAALRASEYDFSSGALLLGCMASCHSLRLIDDALVGDPLDVKMFEFTKWHFAEDFGASAVPLVYETVGKETFGYKFRREFEFVSSLRRMSVVAEKDHLEYVFTKGAPEVMVDICDPTTLPANFDELLYKYTHSGYRVIACASKILTSKKSAKLLERGDAESDLKFCGFIVFENKLKDRTKPTLQELRRAEIRSVMCTGDNVLTAVSVGRECELIDPHVTQVYIPRFASDDEMEASGATGLVWEDMHNPQNRLDPISLQRASADVRDNVHDYILAITGDVFRYMLVELQRDALKEQILMRCNIFARMSPDEKHELVEQLQGLDYTVGFCGDGANDCGALKAADVGISLSEAEASVAAPFTSRVFEISCVLDVIREGRSSLVTSFSCFQYMSLYSAIQFVTVSILYKRGTNLGDFQFLYIDLCLILPLAIFMSWTRPHDQIVVKRPTANLVSPKVLIPLVCQIAVILFFQLLVWFYVQTQPWYMRPAPSDSDDAVQSSDNTMLFLFANFQYIFNAVVLSRGPPYREPMHRNRPYVANLVFAVALSLLLFAIDQNSWWGDFFQLTNMSRAAYAVTVAVAAINFAVQYEGDRVWFGRLARVYKRMRNRNHVSKKRFKNLKQYAQEFPV